MKLLEKCKGYLVRMDSEEHVVIAPGFDAALRASRELWRSDPNSAKDADDEIAIESIEVLNFYGPTVLADECEIPK